MNRSETGGNWRKSRRSVNNGACVEVGKCPAGVGVRDTKEDKRPDRTVLAFSAQAWAEFTAGLKGGAS